jgi:Fructose/tagatose bisphosphate aldolase
MIVTTKQLYKVAYGKFAVGAYNVNNMEQILGLFRGNVQSQAPFIIQLSKGARKYADKRMLEALIRTAEKMFTEAIFAVHLDHGDEETCYDCIDSGFYSSVMIDASHESFDENIAITKRVVDRAHQKGHQRRGGAGPAWRRGGRYQSGRRPCFPNKPGRSGGIR